jgi:hypothetical protein
MPYTYKSLSNFFVATFRQLNCELFVFRLGFTILPLSVSILSKIFLPISDFNEFQTYLVFVFSYSSFLSIGLYASFQFLAARKMLSKNLFYFLIFYGLFLSFCYSFFLKYFDGSEFFVFPNSLIGFIIILYFVNESLLSIFNGLKLYNKYYIFTSLRYLLFLVVVVTGYFSSSYFILFFFEFLLFFLLSYIYFKFYCTVDRSNLEISTVLKNVLPSISSSIGVKNFLFYSTFFLSFDEISTLKFCFSFFGIVNFIPQIFQSDFITDTISSGKLKIKFNSFVFYFSLHLLFSILFSIFLFTIDLYGKDLFDLSFFSFIFLAFLNSLIQAYFLFNQILFALGRSSFRLYNDLLFSSLLLLLLFSVNVLNSFTFLFFVLIAIIIVFMFLFLRFRYFNILLDSHEP